MNRVLTCRIPAGTARGTGTWHAARHAVLRATCRICNVEFILTHFTINHQLSATPIRTNKQWPITTIHTKQDAFKAHKLPMTSKHINLSRNLIWFRNKKVHALCKPTVCDFSSISSNKHFAWNFRFPSQRPYDLHSCN